MFPRVALFCAAVLLSPLLLIGAPQSRESVCDLFEDLKSHDGRMISVRGELFIKGTEAVLAAADCENEFEAAMFKWPTAINLRPAARLPASEKLQLDEAAARIDSIKKNGKAVSVSAVLSGRLHVLTERKGNSRLEDRVE